MPVLLSPGTNTTEIDLTTVVPSVASTDGAIAGIFNWGPVNVITLVDSENTLVNTFGKPNSNNAETWFTASNFLSYTNRLNVVRVANTTSSNSAQSAVNAFGNTGALSNTKVTALNSTDFYSKVGLFDTGVLYIARYPGALGNSLKVSVCDSTNAYSSVLQANGLASSQANDVSASLLLNISSNTATLTVTPGANGSVAAANTYAAALVANLAIGDFISLGNTSIGTQLNKITELGTVTANSTVATTTISFQDPYRLSTAFQTNSSINTTITRYWEYFNVVGTAPITSNYVAQFGNTAAVDTLHVVVSDQDGLFTGVPGTILETYTNVSRATDAKNDSGQTNYYQTIINNGSNYVWVANDRTGSSSNSSLNIASSTNKSALALSLNLGTDGYSESTVPFATIASGYDAFNSAENIDISLVLQGKPIGGISGTSSAVSWQLANYIIDNIVTTRKDCLGFITPDDSVVTQNAGNEAYSILAWKNLTHETSYAVMDSGYKLMYDRYNDVNRWVPLNGDIAGLCASTDAQRDAWWSPAGFNRGQIKNLIKLRWNPRQADRDILYPNGINPVVSFPGQGTFLYGDKTLQSKPSAFDRINVRRLFIVLEKAIQQAAKYFLFEFNDEFTRAQFVNLVTPYLRDIQGRRGITDFYVVCDSTNNTAQVIDTNRFIGDIYIKPARSINFIQLNFVAVGTGVQFSSVVQQF